MRSSEDVTNVDWKKGRDLGSRLLTYFELTPSTGHVISNLITSVASAHPDVKGSQVLSVAVP